MVAPVTVSGDGLTDNNSKAKAGTEVTLTAQPATGFDFGSFMVKTTGNQDVTVTDNKFIMPTEAVTVSAAFEGRPVTATLNVTGADGTTCKATLLDDSYKEISSVTNSSCASTGMTNMTLPSRAQPQQSSQIKNMRITIATQKPTTLMYR